MSETSTFNPTRLDLARRCNGITKRELAERADISLRSLSGYEASERDPNPSTIDRFSEILQFPLSFFYGPDLEEPPSEGSSFRAQSKLTARLRDKALGFGTLGLRLSDWIDERVTPLPQPNIPQYKDVDPEAAAMEIRSSWNIGERPIKNVIHLLESHGVRIFSLSEDTSVLDAYSFWRGDIPYVFLNTMKSAERSRMDAVHELGHLVLHGLGGPQGKEAEQEAQQFGAAFLMPRGDTLAHAPYGGNLHQIIDAKRRWNVSVASLVYRMHKLGLLRDYQYRRLFAEIGRRKYRIDEPNPAPRETSQILSKVFQLLREEGTSMGQVAKTLSLYPERLSKLVFGLVMVPIVVSERPEADERPTPPRPRGHLRLV